MKIFLIDVGSTYIKYSIYDIIKKETIVADRVRFPDPIVDSNSIYEVSEQKIRETIIPLFDMAAKTSCVRAYICVQMHGYLLRNASGWSNYISWRDKRGNVGDARLAEIDFYIRGTKNKQNLPVASLCAGDIDLNESEFFTLGSYISYILTEKNITHSTDACPSGFYNKDTLEKDNSLFQR